jgi:hypothetical protein
MKRAYLEEDLELIRKYFPGAKTVALRTPFDLTPRGRRLLRLRIDNTPEEGGPRRGLQGGVLWLS